MNLKIKICGITNLPDAMAAIEAGADALGFVFFESSPRRISAAHAGEIIRQLPPFIAKVGVFVNERESAVRQTAEASGIDTLQFHGNESPEFCRGFRLKTIKAFRIGGEESLAETKRFEGMPWLLDSYVPGKLGGTGERFNWALAAEAARRNRAVILAGGLTPQNVAEAVRQVRPFGIDVSSGVELSPGKKDLAKIREFISAARAAASALGECA